MEPNVSMPVFADWLAANVSADHGLQLVLFVSLIALTWLFMAKFIYGEKLVLSLAQVLQVIWLFTGAVALVGFLAVR